MGWRKKEPKHGDTEIPRGKNLERSPSAIFKLVCQTLFDNSPANALKFVETSDSINALKGLTSPTPSKKHLSSPTKPPSEESISFADQHSETSTSGSLEYEATEHISRSDFHVRSHGHGAAKSGKKSKGKPSNSRMIIAGMNHSNSSTPASSNRDIYYNGDISSNSFFEIEIEDDLNLTKDQFSVVKNRLESEVDELKRRLEKDEQEMKKLKDELYSLRSSSAGSTVEYPGSDTDAPNLLCESLASEKCDGFDGAQSVSESSGTSVVSDRADGDSQRYMEYCPTKEGQLVKLTRGEQSRSSRICPPHESDVHVHILANTEENLVPVHVRSSSLSKDDLEQYCSESVLEHAHMDTSADVAALGERGTLDEHVHTESEKEPEGTGRQPNTHEGQTDVTPTDQNSEGEKPSFKVFWSPRDEDCGTDDHAARFNKSIMDYGIPDDPEIANCRREIQQRYQEVEEKLMSMLRSPRRDNSLKSPIYSASSSSECSSGTSTPRSTESGSLGVSFTENEQFRADETANEHVNNYYHPLSNSFTSSLRSDFELSLPRDTLRSQTNKFRTRNPLLHPSSNSRGEHEISEEEIGMPATAPECANVNGNYLLRGRSGLTRFGEEAARSTLRRSTSFTGTGSS